MDMETQVIEEEVESNFWKWRALSRPRRRYIPLERI
jgi:hypothetical protein